MGREPSANFHENAANEANRVSRHPRAKRRRGARVSVSPPPSCELIRWSVTIARLSSRDTRDATRSTRRSSASSAPRVEWHAPASPRLTPLTRRYRVARRPDRASASRRVVRTQNCLARRVGARVDRDARRHVMTRRLVIHRHTVTTRIAASRANDRPPVARRGGVECTRAIARETRRRGVLGSRDGVDG